jgi:hypothetical protein
LSFISGFSFAPLITFTIRKDSIYEILSSIE